VRIRPPAADDQARFLAAVHASRSLHHPWTRPPATPAQFRHFLQRLDDPAHASWLVVRTDDEAPVGVFNLSQIVRGNFRSAYLGYYAFAAQAGQGLMQEGLRQVIRQAFRGLKLHRLEANIQPGNTRSIALVRACGFQREGFSPRYLKIGARWRDHERWALVAP
jgi:[ribosomal protein S5]-alanine N-acetyltransferase